MSNPVTHEVDTLPEAESREAPAAASDWEIEEILVRYDKVNERDGTRAGGTTSCH